MVFSSETFLFFFLPAVLLGYFAFARTIWGKNAFLFVASMLFYAWGEPYVVFAMLGSIMANWLFAFLMDSRDMNRKAALVLAICFNVGLLFVFKYLSFAVLNLNSLVAMP